MSWRWENLFNILRFHQEGFLRDKSLKPYAVQWKAKTHARLYYAGDVTERTWRKTYQDRGAFTRESSLRNAILKGDTGKLLVGFSQQRTGRRPIEIGRLSTHGIWGGRGNIFKTLEQMELRLDTSLFRCMFASSIFEAREMITSGGVYVNDVKCTISDHRVVPGDMIQVKDLNLVHRQFRDEDTKLFSRMWAHVPKYWEVNYPTCAAVLLYNPDFDAIPTPYHERVRRHFLEFYNNHW